MKKSDIVVGGFYMTKNGTVYKIEAFTDEFVWGYQYDKQGYGKGWIFRPLKGLLNLVEKRVQRNTLRKSWTLGKNTLGRQQK